LSSGNDVELQNTTEKEHLRPREATNVVVRTFGDGAVATDGIEVTEIMKSIS